MHSFIYVSVDEGRSSMMQKDEEEKKSDHKSNSKQMNLFTKTISSDIHNIENIKSSSPNRKSEMITP